MYFIYIYDIIAKIITCYLSIQLTLSCDCSSSISPALWIEVLGFVSFLKSEWDLYPVTSISSLLKPATVASHNDIKCEIVKMRIFGYISL